MNGMVTGAARRISSGEIDAIAAILNAVDELGRSMDRKWGLGRLPKLVGSEWAEKFAVQSHKLSEAARVWDLDEVRKHGAAMERAYAKLDQLATDAGHSPSAAEQWEFTTAEGLVILVQDRERMSQVETHGRRCQVWSLDEITEVIRNHKLVLAAKVEFQGAELMPMRPVKAVRDDLNDSLDGLPF